MSSSSSSTLATVPLVPVKYSATVIGANLGLNVALSISIVLLNKLVYTAYGFPNMTMTFIHFAFTAAGMFICRATGRFEPASVPIIKMLPTAVTFCGFVVLTNLSLQINTVGTYQIIKAMTTPCVMVIQAFFYGRTFSTKVKLSVIPIIVGVYLNCNYDIRFTMLGMIFAGSGVLVTSLYQVWVNEKQKEFNITSMQLLYYQAPLSALMLLVIIPFFEPVVGPGSLLGGTWSIQTIMLVCLTGVVAFAINLSIFWIIGNTSPLTYNFVGHFKFCLTLLGGFVIFRDPLAWKQVLGITITFVGISYYTHIKLQEQMAVTNALPIAVTEKPVENSTKV